MIEFMFGVLGSVVFWIGFFVVSFFAGTLVLKRIAKKAYGFIMGERDSAFYYSMDGGCWVALIILLIGIYLFWPIILVVLAIGFIVKHILWRSFCNVVKFVDSIIPNIKFEKREGE